jgi:hypothetical protein
VTDASSIASAIAAVVGAVVTVAAFVVQRRRQVSEAERGSTPLPAIADGQTANGVGEEPAQPIQTSHDSPETASRQWSWSRKAALSLLSGVIAGLIVLLIGSALSHSPTAHLTFPNNGTAVSETGGFNAKGTSSHLGNDTIWLTDYDGGYTVDSEATVNGHGGWTAPDSPLGDPGQALPFPLTARVILANTRCAAKLQKVMNTNADYLTALPGGCAVVGAVNVNVTTR